MMTADQSPARGTAGLFLFAWLRAARLRALLPVLILVACVPGTPVSEGPPSAYPDADAGSAATGQAVVDQSQGYAGPGSTGSFTDRRVRRLLPSIVQAGAPGATPSDAGVEPGGGTVVAAATDQAALPDPSDPCAGVAFRDDDGVFVGDESVFFFGVNAHYLLDDVFPEERVEPLLARMSEHGINTVRTWYFHYHDPDRLDRLLLAGARYGIRFILVLEDNVNAGRDWFFSDDDEEDYRPHLEESALRFGHRPEILMWEVINEPNCGDGGFDEDCLKTIRDWVTMASEMLERLDSCHIVSSGMIGAGNFDIDRDNYRRIHRKGSIDIVSVHRRTEQDPEPELDVAEDANKPIYYGEVYDIAHDDGCQPLSGSQSPQARAERVKDDLNRAIEAGADGYILWDYNTDLVKLTSGELRTFCSRFGYGAADPLWDKLATSGLPPAVPWR